MDRFLQCLCDKNYQALVISGNPTEDEITSAWYIIITEYNELKKIDITENPQWSLSQNIIRLHNHLYLLQQCISFLKFRYSESIAKSMRRLGYRFNIVSENPADYMHLLYEASQDCKTKQVELEQAEKQLAKYVKEQGLEEPQYAGFERTLTFIEEMQHTAYDLSTLTVSKFISLENKYRDMVTAAELKAQIN